MGLLPDGTGILVACGLDSLLLLVRPGPGAVVERVHATAGLANCRDLGFAPDGTLIASDVEGSCLLFTRPMGEGDTGVWR